MTLPVRWKWVFESLEEFLAAMEPQPPLPAGLVEYHQGRSRRLRLVLTWQSYLTRGEKKLLDDQHPVHGKIHDSGLLFAYAADRCTEPDWCVLPDSGPVYGTRLVCSARWALARCLEAAPCGGAPTTWYMPHEIPGVFHMLLRHGRGFGLSDLEETANAVGHRPLGSNWFRPEKVKATSSFACHRQSTYKDLSRVDLDLPEGLLVGLGYAATSPDSPLDFRQAQNAAERSGVASPHRWSLMLPTSARVAQEVYEPLIGIQYPMLCSRMGDTWQIGTTSIREDHRIASGLRFVHWCHASPNVHARHNPKNDPTVRVYRHLEDQLTKAGADTDDILALTTTREGATNLRNYFTIADKKANAETAVKVAGATAKHCIVIHGVSTFLSGEEHNLDYDQECFTRANVVAYSRATDLSILACPLNMQGMPGALQVLAALLHGVQTIYTYDSNREPVILGSLDLTAAQVAQATIFFQQALLPHPMWLGPLPVCLAEYHQGKVRRLRLVLAALTHLTKAEIASLREGPHLPGGTVLHDLVYGYAVDASLEPEWLVITDGQQPGRWRLLHNSFGPGKRCSVGSSLRYQPTPSTPSDLN